MGAPRARQDGRGRARRRARGTTDASLGRHTLGVKARLRLDAKSKR